MSEIIITNFQTKFQPDLREIFFDSSTRKEFRDQKEKDEFFWKYMGFYIVNYPQYVFLALKGNKLMGYVLGMAITQNSALYEIQPHLKSFEKYFDSYPAHLHINTHSDCRGQGVGGKLVETLIEVFKKEQVKGIHIMTGLESRNRSFYQRLGFAFEASQDSILFMGKDLV